MSYIRNHLIESLKSISLYSQLADSCPFWLVLGICKSVSCGSDCFQEVLELEKKKKGFSCQCSLLVLNLHWQPSCIQCGMVMDCTQTAWLGCLLRDIPNQDALKYRVSDDLNELWNGKRIHSKLYTTCGLYIAQFISLIFFMKHYSLIVLFMLGSKLLSQARYTHRFHFVYKISLLAVPHSFTLWKLIHSTSWQTIP